MADYFGRGCKYLSGQWGDDELPDHKDWKPIICFCNHPDNPKDEEGNCNKSVCPNPDKKYQYYKEKKNKWQSN